jgi:hypothetical protein
MIATLQVLLALSLAGLGLYLKEYLNQKGKNKALTEDNKRLTMENEAIKHSFAAELEKVKAQHQLDFAKRKHQYEAKYSLYQKHFSLLDEISKQATTDFRNEYFPLLSVFHAEHMKAVMEEDKEGILAAIGKMSEGTYKITAKYNEGMIRVKQETYSIKLIGSDAVIKSMKELDLLLEETFEVMTNMMKKMNSMEFILDQTSLEPIAEESRRVATATIAKTNELVFYMREELKEI